MRCPSEGCDGRLRVLNTHASRHHVRRGRRCEKCGQRFGTSEFVTPHFQGYVDDSTMCAVLSGLINGVRPTVLARRWGLPVRRVLQLRDTLLVAQGENARLASQELATPPEPA